MIVADGGTRTASITGGMVALANLLHTEAHRFSKTVLKSLVGAVSVGVVKGAPVLDLNYVEDRDAEVDANVVGIARGGFAEVQVTSEHGTFGRAELDGMLDLAAPALEETLRTTAREDARQIALTWAKRCFARWTRRSITASSAGRRTPRRRCASGCVR